jgi:hypothetical protein
MNEGNNANTASVKNRARLVVCISGCALSQRRDQGSSFKYPVIFHISFDIFQLPFCL